MRMAMIAHQVGAVHAGRDTVERLLELTTEASPGADPAEPLPIGSATSCETASTPCISE